MPKLKPRLRMAAELVRDGVRIADIGTDHAYLPAALILEGRITGAVAADLRKGPLENAAQTVRANGLTDRISLRLSDGLANVSAGEADDIVIAGMGGILIAEILGACPFLKDGSKRYILQPQSHSEELRAFLWSSGFRIFGESAC
ncbi:MAG: SAM-dependent methyltransferase, partial [Clostridia bacterium]|nr:SAM-dependent methyltransferase [Clostridia bacterium]